MNKQNRPISYRAWNKKEKKMGEVWAMKIENCYHLGSLDSPLCVQVNTSWGDKKASIGCNSTWLMKDVELMQWTGLLDKNGVKIFKGDIVKAIVITGYIEDNEEEDIPEPSHAPIFEEKVGEVYRHDFYLAYKLKLKKHLRPHEEIFDTYLIDLYGHETLEVIGNIYSNPDIIK